MVSTVFGYAINGNKVDIWTMSVALACIPVSWAWANLAVWWFNRSPANINSPKTYPLLGSWERLILIFLTGSSLVPLLYLMLSTFSADALKDLLEASRYTLAIGGMMGFAMSLKEIFK